MRFIGNMFSSLFGRLSLWVAVVTIVSVIALYAMTYWIVRTETEQQIARAVDTDIAGLADIYISGGAAELSKRLKDRLELLPPGGERYYLLASASGKTIAGNIPRWPELSSENSEAAVIVLSDNRAIFARATQLDPDLKLVVGQNLSGMTVLLNRIGAAFATAGAVLVLVIIMIGHGATLRLNRRVGAINTAFRDISSGELTRQVPVDDRGDELDELSRHTNNMTERLSALIGAHRDISDNTAHELRTPLTHLDTRLVQALGEVKEPRQVETLNRARQDIRDIIAMLDSLLDIASSQAKKGDLSGLSEIDLSVITMSMADLFAESADELGIEFQSDIAAGVKLLADPSHIQRILSNLLDNAFKYVPRGGTVRLSLRPGPVIVVQDDGPGVATALHEKIFERFARVDGSDTPGHGLGLALSQALAERNGLSIVCRNASPGALFEVKPAGAS
ncbi:sensor histidine kinase [Parasphingorhabdus halotolerans]|uniref:histidine kinase n=1 Tax=Parasphingorhabdus halotolerans TaxID=2725558 RepID=A0A6H2DQR4_9SPHN|nr:HAMP domain-containing sensor histidine kinase [Parasphingorhabdus halotolerans]QJB70467.1 HAMP domain-containing histidine kinase [Parasphingorhabdus halotolerans]